MVPFNKMFSQFTISETDTILSGIFMFQKFAYFLMFSFGGKNKNLHCQTPILQTMIN